MHPTAKPYGYALRLITLSDHRYPGGGHSSRLLGIERLCEYAGWKGRVTSLAPHIVSTKTAAHAGARSFIAIWRSGRESAVRDWINAHGTTGFAVHKARAADHEVEAWELRYRGTTVGRLAVVQNYTEVSA